MFAMYEMDEFLGFSWLDLYKIVAIEKPPQGWVGFGCFLSVVPQ